MMHQSRICLTVKSILSGTFILLLLMKVSGLGSVVSRQYWYFHSPYTWQDAQSYCRGLGNHTDLATIYAKSDEDTMNLKTYIVWLSLHNGDHEWNWPSGLQWASNESNNGDNCAVVYYNDDNVYGAKCDQHFFFICDNPKEVITQAKTMQEAWRYCQDHNNHGLATFSDINDLNSVAVEKDFPVWIGLHRDGETWKWSAGLSDYTNWALNEPQNNKSCVAISSLSKNMTSQNCSTRFPFLCYRDNLVLIKENKTWEEALEYCRALSSPTSYDLVSVQPEDYNYVMNKVMEAKTEEVWTGLRFLAGEWLWINGANMLYSDLPLCPTMVQHCGALSMNSTGSMEPRNCAERKYFMCYRK